MKISKALMLAMQNGEKYSEIYSAVLDEKTFQDLSPIENEKLITLNTFVDDQLKEIILEPLKDLKRRGADFHLTDQRKCCWDHLTNWDKNTNYLWVECKRNSSSKIHCYLWICPLVKPLVYDIGFFISFTELEHNVVWEDRRVIEEEICNILGNDWITSYTDYFERRKGTAAEDDLKNDFKTKGGYVTYISPIVLNQDDKIEDIQKQIIQIGNIGFVNNINKMKKYWKELYDK